MKLRDLSTLRQTLKHSVQYSPVTLEFGFQKHSLPLVLRLLQSPSAETYFSLCSFTAVLLLIENPSLQGSCPMDCQSAIRVTEIMVTVIQKTSTCLIFSLKLFKIVLRTREYINHTSKCGRRTKAALASLRTELHHEWWGSVVAVVVRATRGASSPRQNLGVLLYRHIDCSCIPLGRIHAVQCMLTRCACHCTANCQLQDSHSLTIVYGYAHIICMA